MRWIAGIGWGLFCLILLWMGKDFLFACEARFASYIWDSCPARIDQPLVAESERAEALQRRIHAAEMALAEKPVCEPVVEKKPEPDTNKRAYDRGAKSGKLEVFLAWHTLDDLDLEIECPGGKIGGQSGQPGPGVCGDGRVDLDANKNLKENIETEPVEHAVWRDQIPLGTYRFKAHLFMAKDSSYTHEIPFEMTISVGDKQQVCRSSLPFFPLSEGRTAQSGGVLATRSASIIWRSNEDPPRCDWIWDEATFCRGGCPKQ